jgi:hypothetical protein
VVIDADQGFLISSRLPESQEEFEKLVSSLIKETFNIPTQKGLIAKAKKKKIDLSFTGGDPYETDLTRWAR